MDTLKMYIITWNVATRSPEESLSELLNIKRENGSTLPDFYIIGLQEVKSQPQNFVMDAIFNDPWTNAFRDSLAPYDYVRVKTARLVGLLLSIFCLRKHIPHLRRMQVEYTKTGLLGLWGNKGAVTIRLDVYGCSLCFVNCHLAPHDNMVKDRIDDYNSIIRGQKFDTKETTTILFHDYIFWFGDLNFRLNEEMFLSSIEIVRAVRLGNFSSLLQYDQLKQVMESGEAFSELTENGPAFRPTYKFNYLTQEYDTKRRPAWTDRILFRVNKNAYENITLEMKQLTYSSFEQYSVSDHKPVVSEFAIKVFSMYEEESVIMEPLGEWFTDKENKAKIKINGTENHSIWNWIGIYQANFSALDEYVHYIYLSSASDVGNNLSLSSSAEVKDAPLQQQSVPSCSDYSGEIPEKVFEVAFPDTAVRTPGMYKLLCISQNFVSVLGISESFQVKENPLGVKIPIDW